MKNFIKTVAVSILFFLAIPLHTALAQQEFPLIMEKTDGVSYDEEVSNFHDAAFLLNQSDVEDDALVNGKGFIKINNDREERYHFEFDELTLDEQGFFVGDVVYEKRIGNDTETFHGKINIHQEQSLATGSIKGSDENSVYFTVGEDADSEQEIKEENEERRKAAVKEEKDFDERNSAPNSDELGSLGYDQDNTYDPNLLNSHYSNNVYLHFVGSTSKPKDSNYSKYKMRVGISESLDSSYKVLDSYFYFNPSQYSSGYGLSAEDVYPKSSTNTSLSVGYSYLGVSVGLSTSSANYSVKKNSGTTYTYYSPNLSTMDMGWEGTISNSGNKGAIADFYIAMMGGTSNSCYGYDVRGGVDVRSYVSGNVYSWKSSWDSGCIKVSN
ncbi:hypothetical protein GCM10010954_16350 [Halobacillus andaensis]|uniref:Uncharacterized protein n=1 Tax=Halobacillus andaensis TaxID=1176239 RepID=A0A917EUK4_HALAA|nr:hypothetical protein [Halobacillus andaensis]MBP2004863.1 hypothetical protein [Halobacillus andaensis]GGF18326.1 hypothetical protein GCM10010954_16350 [Halobacillus andaensis]